MTEIERFCPICNGPMGARETICADCRAELERATMAVRAEDYPPPSLADRPNPAPSRPALPSAGDILDTRVDTSLDDAPDMLDLVPIDEPVRPTAPRIPSLQHSTPYAGAARTRLAPERTPVEVEKPSSALHPEGHWKAAIVAIAIILLAGLLAAAIWSYVVPSFSASSPPDSSSVGPPAP